MAVCATKLLVSAFVVVGLLLLLSASIVHGDVHYHDFVLKEKNYTRLCSTKSMLVVNDSFPGPTIYVKKGDTLYVNVRNQGGYGVTIHWHGVNQPRNPWFDGAEYVTQCSISPGTNFTYQVLFTEEEGSLWWHAHSEWARYSIHGFIVIHPADGTSYPFPQPDGEKEMVLASWYTEDVYASIAEKLAAGSDLLVSEAYTINGEPGDFCECSNETTHRWMVDYGKTYLLRLLNADMNAELFFAIADHNVTVVGSDAAYLKPFSSEIVFISPGQTIDVLVTANQPPGRYYIAARQYYSNQFKFSEYDHANATAILEYSGNYTAPSTPVFPSGLPSYTNYKAATGFVQSMRNIIDHVNVPMNITTRMYITVSLNKFTLEINDTTEESYPSASLNNISWYNPWTDVLQAYYRNISGFYTTDFPEFPPTFFNFTQHNLPLNTTNEPERGTKVKVLEYNEEVEIVFQNTDVANSSENHPMHLHGHSFYVLGTGFGNYNNETDPLTFNLIDPPYQNTASVPKDGWLAIRFRASNPGVWLWHCHLDKHLTWGMNSVFIVKNGGTEDTSIRDPPSYMPSCYPDSKLRLEEFSNSDEKLYSTSM